MQNSPPYTRLTLDAPTRTRICFWFRSDAFLRRPLSSYQDSCVHSLWGGLQAKGVPEWTTCRVTWGVPQRVSLSVSSSILCSDMSSWANASGTLKIKMTTRKRRWVISLTHAHHTNSSSRQLGTTADRRCDITRDWLRDACLMARVCWGMRCKGFFYKEGPHYCIEQSARNPLEHDQVPRALGEFSRSCRQTSNNQPQFTSSEIRWGFLAWAVLHWLSRDLCHARSTYLRILCEKKRYDSWSPNGRLHEKSLEKGGTGKENQN